MKTNKNKWVIIASMLLFLVISLPLFGDAIKKANAFGLEGKEGEKKPVFSGQEIVLLGHDFDFAGAGQTADTFTPFDFENKERMAGNSWSPRTTTFTEEPEFPEHEYIDFETILFESTQTLSTYGKSLYFWIYFNSFIPKRHDFYLIKDDDNYLKWTITTTAMSDLFKKTNASSMDETVFTDGDDDSGNTIPFGWNLIELPISNAIVVGDINATTDDFIGFAISQETYDMPFENNVLIYNLLLDTNSGSSKIKNHIAQDNVVFLINTIKTPDKKYFAGEIFNEIPTFNYIFGVGDVGNKGYLWIGKTDYSQYSDISEYSKYFSVIIKNSKGSKSYDLGGGGDFSLEAGNYVITYCVHPNAGDNKEVSRSSDVVLYFDEFVVGSYGQGVWFMESRLNGTIGETYVIHYKVHEAFNGFSNDITIEFEKEGVLELVEHNKFNKTITFKVIAEGSTAIKLTLTSGRLSPEYIDVDYLENSDFVVNAVQPKTGEGNSIKIMLWVVLGLLLAFGLGYLIKTIIDSRKIEVK